MSYEGRSAGAVILNPESGNGGHVDRVQELAAERGFDVFRTEAAGDAVDLAREAGRDVDLVAAAGGDGTINEVVRGLDAADALETTTLAVIPAGTGNNFATNLGVEGIDHAFEVIDRDEGRTIDVGTANGQLFVNSCVGGLTADASADTSSELKRHVGVLAYVFATLRRAAEFEGMRLQVRSGGDGGVEWAGEALVVLIGNGRRFPAEGRTQADMEDGLLDVTIVERVPAASILEEAAVQRLFGGETENIARLKTPELELDALQAEPIQFSFDGEMSEHVRLSVGLRERSLRILVGEAYEPHPDD